MKTILYDRHVALHAKMALFAGWEMPIEYQGVIQEHQAVRNGVGIFDVSHMGRVLIEGVEAENFLELLSSNYIGKKKNGSAIYTVWCDENGGTVDDLIVYKKNSRSFSLIVNASNRMKDLGHMKKYAGPGVTLTPLFEEGIVAIQGPLAENLVKQLFRGRVLPSRMEFDQNIAGTGYTGEKGYEIWGPKEEILPIWDHAIALGALPIGLAARDTLRLEMGYALYGHELSEKISPTESVSAWAVHSDKDFIGKEQLKNQKQQRGIILTGPGIARDGYEIFKENKQIGYVTSGTMSPSLKKAIAIVSVEKEVEIGDVVEVQIRRNRVQAKVVALPFYKGKE